MADRTGRWQQFLQSGGAQAIATGNMILLSLRLTPAAAAAVVDIKEGGSGGAVVLSMSAAANGNSDFLEVAFAIKDPYISTFTGAGAKLSVLI